MKIITLLILFLFTFSFYGQKLRTIYNIEKKYKIDIPENWKENKMFKSKSLSFMALKAKTDKDPNPFEAIAIKHYTTNKIYFKDAFQEYLNLVKEYYKGDFEILNRNEIIIQGRKFIKLITEVKSHINGEEKKNIMIYTFANGESTMITLTSTVEKFKKNSKLFKKIYSSFLLEEYKKSNSFIDLILDMEKIDTVENDLSVIKSKYPKYKIAKRSLILNDNQNHLKHKINNLSVGEIIQKADKYFALKILKKHNVESAKVSSINLSDSSIKSQELANKIIDDYHKGLAFSELAKEYSVDKFYSKKGGDIGWIKKGQMTKEIDNSIFTHKKGDIFIVNPTELGTCIILINESAILSEYAELLIAQKKL